MKALKFALIAALMAALAHAPADAGQGGEQKRARKSPPAVVSGSYSGSLSGTIAVGSQAVVIPKKVSIYDTHGNKLAPGTSISGRSLYVSGRMEDGKLVAALIVVSDASKADFSEETLPGTEADPNRER